MNFNVGDLLRVTYVSDAEAAEDEGKMFIYLGGDYIQDTGYRKIRVGWFWSCEIECAATYSMPQSATSGWWKIVSRIEDSCE